MYVRESAREREIQRQSLCTLSLVQLDCQVQDIPSRIGVRWGCCGCIALGVRGMKNNALHCAQCQAVPMYRKLRGDYTTTPWKVLPFAIGTT